MKKTMYSPAKGKETKKLKGFTLVELIVVMVILALLMALAVPQVTKYIDKAGDITMKSEARACYTAVQAYCVEAYESSKLTGQNLCNTVKNDLTSSGYVTPSGMSGTNVGFFISSVYTKNNNSTIWPMANVPDNGYITEIQFDKNGTAVKKLVYKYANGTSFGNRYVVYENGKYDMKDN